MCLPSFIRYLLRIRPTFARGSFIHPMEGSFGACKQPLTLQSLSVTVQPPSVSGSLSTVGHRPTTVSYRPIAFGFATPQLKRRRLSLELSPPPF